MNINVLILRCYSVCVLPDWWELCVRLPDYPPNREVTVTSIDVIWIEICNVVVFNPDETV